MDREKLVICLLLLISFFLWILLQIWTNELYVLGLDQQKIEQEYTTYRHENIRLKDELLEKESYREISKKATLSGFIPAPFVTP